MYIVNWIFSKIGFRMIHENNNSLISTELVTMILFAYLFTR